MDTTEIKWPPRKRRGRYSNEFKHKLVEACCAPGISTAAVALANGINANLLRRWVSELHDDSALGDVAAPVDPQASRVPEFVRLDREVPAPGKPRLELQFQRGDVRITAFGSGAECAVFVRAFFE